VSVERYQGLNDEVRARHERIDRLLEELRASVRKRRAITDRWRAEGILPPEEPRRRF
jgi:hypothetical protein